MSLNWTNYGGVEGVLCVATNGAQIWTVVRDGADCALVRTIGPKGHVRRITMPEAKQIAEREAEALA